VVRRHCGGPLCGLLRPDREASERVRRRPGDAHLASPDRSRRSTVHYFMGAIPIASHSSLAGP
jgi:hypothetical protein